MPDTHLIAPGSKVQIDELPTRGDAIAPDRDAAEAEFKRLRKRLVELQGPFYAEGRQKLLIVLQAMDAGGKDGTTRRVFGRINPQGCRVSSFKAPTSKELARDFLWRIHREVPGRGMIRIFNRSHYEDVLVVRVESLVPEAVWRPRYELINDFERLLTATGTTILKFYLHISKEEQRERLQARLDLAEKRWKFSREDLVKRRQWDEYMTAYAEALERTSTAAAPWYAIPSDQKWYRNLAIARTVVAKLEELDPRFPEAEAGLEEIVVE